MILLDHQQSETIAGVIYERSTMRTGGSKIQMTPRTTFYVVIVRFHRQ